MTPTYDSATIRFPDIVWNWRIDQAWGAAMIGGAVHDASAGSIQGVFLFLASSEYLMRHAVLD